MTLSLDRQNQYRERFRRARTGWQPATEVYEGLIRAALRPGCHALDIGCGRGGVLEQVGDGVTYPFGVDPDGVSLVEHRLPELPRAVALADALPFKDESFDLILCSWVLEHVAEPERVFNEAARCLKPGGAFIFLTPNARAFVTLLNRILKPAQAFLVPRLYGRAESDTFPVVYRANTGSQIKQLAGNAKLQMEQLRSISDPSYLAFNPLLYRLSVWISGITPPVHLVGCCRRV